VRAAALPAAARHCPVLLDLTGLSFCDAQQGPACIGQPYAAR